MIGCVCVCAIYARQNVTKRNKKQQLHKIAQQFQIEREKERDWTELEPASHRAKGKIRNKRTITEWEWLSGLWSQQKWLRVGKCASNSFKNCFKYVCLMAKINDLCYHLVRFAIFACTHNKFCWERWNAHALARTMYCNLRGWWSVYSSLFRSICSQTRFIFLSWFVLIVFWFFPFCSHKFALLQHFY